MSPRIAMEPTRAQDYYTGIVARLYRPLRSAIPDPEPYAAFIAAAGEPALELGCGDGDPMLDLRARGLDVDGVDSSADMLEGCRRAAEERDLEVTLYHQPMQSMDLARTYRSIYLAGATFNLLPDDDVALRVLQRVRAHLEPGGSALIPLIVPKPTSAEELGTAREHRPGDGTTMRFTVVAEDRDEDRRIQTSLVRYELRSPTEDLSEERSWRLHWYTQDAFRGLAATAGLSVSTVLAPDATPAALDADSFVFWLTSPGP